MEKEKADSDDTNYDEEYKQLKTKRQLYPLQFKTNVFHSGLLHDPLFENNIDNLKVDSRLDNAPILVTHNKRLDGNVLIERFSKSKDLDLEQVYQSFVSRYLSNTSNSILGEYWHREEVRDYDLHEVNYQDFAVRITNSFSVEKRKMMTYTNHADKSLIRTRYYAISARTDYDWNGNVLTSNESKQKKLNEMIDYWKSYTLYNWNAAKLSQSDSSSTTQEESPSSSSSSYHDHLTSKPNPKYSHCQYSVHNESTQEGVKNLFIQLQNLKDQKIEEKSEEKHSGDDLPERIGWLNMANAHNCGGTYNVPFGGSQEEATATVTNSIVAFGLASVPVVSKKWYTLRDKAFKAPHIMYRYGYHIPKSGNYTGKSKFLILEEELNQQLDTVVISTAFADFRALSTFSSVIADQTYSERNEYFHSNGQIKDEQQYKKRIKQDIEGTLLSAIEWNCCHLVLGASGCGAFLHHPKLEAKMWKTLLESDEYKGYFKTIRFSILAGKNKEDHKNVAEFTQVFCSSDQDEEILS